MHTSPEQVLRYGGRQAGVWMHSLPVPVCHLFSPAKCVQNPLLGTGGTVAGVGQYLKSMNEDVFVAIADPDGSGLCNKVKDELNDYAYILLKPPSLGKIRSDVRSKGERGHEEETSS